MHFAGQHTPPPILAAARRLPGAVHAAPPAASLRGVTPMPFDTLYVGIADNTQFGADVRRSLPRFANTKLVNSPKEAQAILQQVNDARTLREVSLNAQGRVESYELGINFTFRLIDAKGNALIPDTTLSIYREMPYDDQIVQAKQGQIETLYAMQRDLVSRLLRHDRADVRKAFENPGKNEDGVDAPVYDPNAAQPVTLPPLADAVHHRRAAVALGVHGTTPGRGSPGGTPAAGRQPARADVRCPATSRSSPRPWTRCAPRRAAPAPSGCPW